MKDFNGKVAVVTGGASGVGRCLAQQLAAEGAKVVITDINAEKLAAVAAELNGEGSSGSVEGIACDVTKEESVQALAIRSSPSTAVSICCSTMPALALPTCAALSGTCR